MMGYGIPWPMILAIGLLASTAIAVAVLIRVFTRPAELRRQGAAANLADATLRRVAGRRDTGRDTYVVIPDISGYTNFLRLTRFAADHAHYVVTELLEAMLTAAQPPLLATRVEGDSVMFYATTTRGDPAHGVSGSAVADAVVAMLMAFFERRTALIRNNLCPCNACERIAELTIKVVVHRGPILHYSLGGLDDLSGLSVIEAHRLLKNSVSSPTYVLVSDAAADEVSLPWQREAHREYYEDVGELNCELYVLDAGEVIGDTRVTGSRALDLMRKLSRNVRNLSASSPAV